jgi:hypothetical protein
MKKTVATGLMGGLGAPGAGAVTESANAKTHSHSSCCGDDYSINCSPDRYYWRRWQVRQPNGFLKRCLLLQQRLRRLIETRHRGVRRPVTLLVTVLALALALSGCAWPRTRTRREGARSE